ncbi:hypothetical protein ACH4ZU_11980 [Streptomyces sp. NPDC020472]|uniref:hypothetical protein n=1 Tax=Streptomyces sp. NPDC020472 TaxID=3365075 RepID=UPI003795DB9F
MDVTITVRVCDICKRQDRPATRYTLTVDGAKPKVRDLCDDDAAPVLATFDEAVEEAREDAAPSQDAAPAKKTTMRRTAPAKKAVAKKIVAKKAAAGRRGKTPVMTMEEIEALKSGASKT